MTSRCRETQAHAPAPLFTALVRACLLVAPALLLALSTPSAAPAQTLSRERLDELKRSVVKINAAGKIGTGIVIGAEDDKVFVVTAFHVVDGAEDIRVTFFDRRYETFLAASPKYDERLDIALVVITRPAGRALTLNLQPIQLSEVEPSEGLAVTVIGQGNDSEWQYYRGVVVREEHDNDYSRFRHDARIEQGDSGAPVFDDSGRLLGIVTTRIPRGQGASSVKIEEVHRVLTRSWRVPTSLLQKGKDQGGPPPVERPPRPDMIFETRKELAEARVRKRGELAGLIPEGEKIVQSALSPKELKRQYDLWMSRCVKTLRELDEIETLMKIRRGPQGQPLPKLEDVFEGIAKLEPRTTKSTRLRQLILGKLRDSLVYLNQLTSTSF